MEWLCSNQANSQGVFQYDLMEETVKCVTAHQFWITGLIYCYSTSEIDMYEYNPAVNICKIRSGFQFLLDEFYGVTIDFDEFLKDLIDDGDVEVFDDSLKVWMTCGVRGDLSTEEIYPKVPTQHWGWF